ncbi:MAG: fumarylacetoacetate hydrolase family protein [Candidatus Latescibacterota bacterium]
MRLLQFIDPDTGLQHLGLVRQDEVIDLSQGPGAPRSLHQVYYALGGNRRGLVPVVEELAAGTRHALRLSLAELLGNRGAGARLLAKPVSGPEGDPHALRIWLAGVTHADSARLREIEAKQATGGAVNVYEQKYRECAGGGRPELFPKNEPDDVVAHGQPVTRPADTLRLVPETELVTVYGLDAQGQVERLGYTGGNDVTDNGIEAANPLNLPQAKNWAGGCASLGPVLVTADEFDDRVVEVSCEVLRQGRRVAYKEGETGQERLNMPDRLFHMERMLFSRIPLRPGQLQVLYWGTPIVFAESDLAGGLQVGDVMRLGFWGGIGVLENPIAALPEPGQVSRLAGA